MARRLASLHVRLSSYNECSNDPGGVHVLLNSVNSSSTLRQGCGEAARPSRQFATCTLPPLPFIANCILNTFLSLNGIIARMEETDPKKLFSVEGMVVVITGGGTGESSLQVPQLQPLN